MQEFGMAVAEADVLPIPLVVEGIGVLTAAIAGCCRWLARAVQRCHVGDQR